jgi:subtilisin family serine protease
VLCAAALLSTGTTGTGSAAPSKSAQSVKGELIVGFEPGLSRAQENAILKAAGATSKKRFGQIDAVLVKVTDDEELAVTKALSSDPRVSYVEPNHILTVAATPNDPDFGQLWGLHNTGQSGGTSDKDIDAPEAWDLATGDPDVVVAVTDTGVDFTHPDLAAQRWVNTLDPVGGGDDDGNGLVDDWSGWDFVNDDNDPADDHGHGTHVSGTIGAAGNNGVGVVGVNWNVKIMPLKFLNSAGSGSTSDAMASVLFAADHGADVSSNSWGGGPFDQALLDAIEYGASRGMLFVAAAGNDARNNDVTPTYPASYASDAVLAVAATDHNDERAFFSSYGAKSVDLGAPGVGIYSTWPGNTYRSADGTSMATPHVAGAAALVEARFPGATPYGVKALLMNSVDAAASLAGATVTGGRLNVGNALACANEPQVLLGSPADGFVVGVGDALPIRVVGASCATPAGLANVTVTVNGTPVSLSAASPDSGLYTGSYTVAGEGALTVTATVSVGGTTDTKAVNGNAFRSYTCQDVPLSWVDVTVVPPLSGADGDDTFSTLNIGFPFTFFGQTHTQTFVSSNGFLALGSSAGATAFLNSAIPSTSVPNGLIAPFWDDLFPGSTGSVHAGVAGSPGSRVLYVEWFNVPHFSLSGSGTATFEVALYEATGEVRMQWLDTDLGNPTWNLGASATAGVERQDGVVGRQVSFDQPLLTSGRAVSCTFGAAPPPPPPPPTITTTSLPDGMVGSAYSQTLAAVDGTLPYAWSVSAGDLPPGLALAATGELSGTPSSAGTFTFTARVDDSGTPSQSDTQELTVTIDPEPVPPPTITTTSLPGGTVGQPYSQALAATGGTQPYAWSLDAGALPPGLALNASTGAITGTPTSGGTNSFTVRVTDAGAQTDTQDLSIAVGGPTEVLATPDATTVSTGSLRSGTAASLAADDDVFYEVDSSTSGQKTTAWYGTFSGVTNALSSLRVSYSGKNSRSCSQTVHIWNWNNSSWVQLDSRTVGATEVSIANLAPGGTLSRYVSGTTGDGDLRVRVRCRVSGAAFFASGDRLQISYVRP